jgi:[ribosomal protein S18]-alanine N-acetyltransferase
LENRLSARCLAYKMPVTIRNLEPEDTERIRELLSEIPEAVRWTAGQEGASGNGLRCRVAECDQRISGLIVFRKMADEAEILNLAVEVSRRRQGIGWLLVQSAIAECKAAAVKTIFLEVRASNERARRLYARAGFKEGGRRREYYREPTEDALVLKHTIE